MQAFSHVLWCSGCPQTTARLAFFNFFTDRSVNLTDSRVLSAVQAPDGALALPYMVLFGKWQALVKHMQASMIYTASH